MGTTHPTGYPLYALLTFVFSHLPFGSLAFRGNLFSAACAIGAAVVMQRTLRLLGVHGVAAVATSVAFGLTRIHWGQSVIAEVYSLNILLVALAIFLFLRWERLRTDSTLISACCAYALGFGNHLTVITFLPALVWLTLAVDVRVLARPRTLLAILSAIVCCALLYLYPIWRTKADSVFLEYQVHTFADLINYVSGDHYRRAMFGFSPAQLLTERLPRLASLLIGEWGVFGLLATVGLWRLEGWTRRVFLLLSCLSPFVWTLNYNIPDIEIYLIPCVYILGLFVGLGLNALGELALRAKRLRAPGLVFVAVLSLALPATLFRDNIKECDQSRNTKFSRQIDKLVRVMGDGALVLWFRNYGERMALVYWLYGEDQADARRLFMRTPLSAKLTVRYLEGRERAVRDDYAHRLVPVGLRVVTNHKPLARALKSRGYKSRALGMGLYEILPKSAVVGSESLE